MNRINYINTITSLSARFVLEVEGFNATNQYHINIHSENFLIPVLNEIFGLQLENLNSTQKKNFPAIDLADFKNLVAFQITATSSLSKIKDTLTTFFEKDLNRQFDILYFYIITEKKSDYSQDKVNALIPSDFSFSVTDHIIDKDNLLQRIFAISSTPKIEAIARLYQHEFSDIQIEARKEKFQNGYLNPEPENLFPNLLRVTFPDKFYKAELNVDEEAITARVNEQLIRYDKKPVKKLKRGKLIKRALKETNGSCDDWIFHEGCIYTFKDLTDDNEPLRKIIDAGTVTPLGCSEYYESNEDAIRVFKNLLRRTLTGLCATKEIEWFGTSKVYRFANNPKFANQKRVKWKGKNEATKTVIFQMMNKEKQHIICYRNLAFKASFLRLDDWYLVVNPTWSFTNPGGYNQSRFESAYMSGIKRLENNNAVYNYFRFFGYYLSYTDLFTTHYPYLQVHPTEPVEFIPKLDEKKWIPAKIVEKKSPDIPADLEADNELDQTLFDE